jgi:superfamily II DNA or RNA helicase
VLLVEFMGTGKTVTMASLIRGYVAQGARVLILVHRGEILKQTLDKLKRAGLPPEMIGVIWGAHEGLNLDAPVQLASVQTLAGREPPPGITHVVIDEAHHAQAATWRKVLAWYPEAKMLGLTATPERLDGKPINEFFDHMVLGELSETLIADGWLAKPEIWTREDGWRPKKLKKRGNGDYSPEEAARAMSGSTIVGGIPRAYLKHGEGLPAVLFAATKVQAATLVAAFKRVNVAAETLFGEDSDDARDAKLARLKLGTTKVLCTCDVLGEGWDFAGCRVVIMARPTASLARYMQWAGRAMRPGGKAIILDHAGNYYVHGAPWEDHEWSLEGRPKKPSLFAPSVDKEGRVTFIGPREVNGVLVRADHIDRQTVCAGWGGACPTGAKPGIGAFFRARVIRRGGGPWRCPSCTSRKSSAAKTPEQRSESARKARASMTPEQKSDAGRKASATQTPEQRSERGRKANTGMTPEQRSKRARKASATKTPEQRSAPGHKVNAGMTPEQRSERGRKMNENMTSEQRGWRGAQDERRHDTKAAQRKNTEG